MRALPIVTLSLLLAACGDSGISLTNASIEDVVTQSKGMQRQQPGAWETTTEILAMDLGPAIPGPVAEIMKRKIGEKRTENSCLTPDQAKSTPFAKLPDRNGCRFDHFKMGGGTLDALMRCSTPNGIDTMIVSQNGAYSATAFDLTSKVTRKEASGTSAGSMSMHIVGHRTGDCKS